ncbi:hexose transporter HXT5 [Sugiyamaella lignohabitans]|uniref:Hexose transporter HXT5 n=1 Tax=Sugiyamaella lignohabitans TaxID=796027 RepID=A0A167FRU6_9ASCO|nr:hexose transporter HXT5 [Sugiyamaella lignohabitans]ANB15622.1 hexose transporter HXT5 [Sugiyamaella lignohabitans]
MSGQTPASSYKEPESDDENHHPAANNTPVATAPVKSSYVLVSILCVFAAMGGFIFGYDTGTISGYVNMPVFIKKLGNTNDAGEHYLSKSRSGLIIGIFSIGACIGGIFFSRLGDMYGRKAGIWAGTAIYIIGSLIQVTTVDAWYQFFIGRLIGGMGVGTMSVLVPMFQSEVSPSEIRGTLVSSYQLMITLGIFIGYVVCYCTNTRDGALSYKIPLSLGFAWSVVLIVGLVFLPESPRYLMTKDKNEEALKVLCWINGRDAQDPLIVETIANVSAAIEHERRAGKARWSEVITGKPRVGYRLMVGIVVLALQQLVGANYFFYFGTTIFKGIGMNNSFKASIIFGAVNFGSTFFGLYFVEKFGRRNVLLYGAAGMFVFFIIYACMGARALYPNGEDQPGNAKVGKAMIFVTSGYIFCFATTWAPCAFVLVSELFPIRTRSKGMSLGLGANWIANFLISFFTSFITNAIHFYYGFVFAGCNLFAVFFVYFFVHETKGLSLEQIDQLFRSNVKPWNSGSWVPPSIVDPDNYDHPKEEQHPKTTHDEHIV